MPGSWRTGLADLAQRFEALESYLAEQAAHDRFSGVVVIQHGGEQVFAGAYGYASRAWRIPPTLSTRFDTASITKVFTGVAVLQLIDKGRLSLDMPVVPYLELGHTRFSRDITPYHLLTHSSGLGDDADEEAGESYAALFIDKPNYSITETVHFLPGFIDKPANFAPGAGCRYCNVGYVLLGLMVERATGQTYRDYVREHVFVPAGMASSGFLDQSRVNANLAEGADPIRDPAGNLTGWKRNIFSYPPIGSPDGGAHVTAPDLLRFHAALRAGALLSPESTRAFLKPQVYHSEGDGWTGFGLWFMLKPADDILYYQKEGINAGASAMLRHYPRPDLTVVVLSNLEDGAWAPVRKIHELIGDA
jgi:CubicO group peptidase (beta-lactamase class C family)